MINIIIAIFLGIVSIIFILYFFKYIKPKEPEACIKFNFIDFKENNYNDVITLKTKCKKILNRFKVYSKSINLDFFGFNGKRTLQTELNISNSNNQKEKNFRIKIYKNYKNIINIKINNESDIYYDSEFIFYCQSTEQKIKLDNL